MAEDSNAVYGRVISQFATNPALKEYRTRDDGKALKDAYDASEFGNVTNLLKTIGGRMAAKLGTADAAESKLKDILGSDDFCATIGEVPGTRGSAKFKNTTGFNDPLGNFADIIDGVKHDPWKAAGLVGLIVGVTGAFSANGMFAKMGMLTLTALAVAMLNGKGVGDLVSSVWDSKSSHANPHTYAGHPTVPVSQLPADPSAPIHLVK